MNLKTLHSYANNNDFESFKRIMTEEISKGGIIKLTGLLKASSNLVITADKLKEHVCAHFDITDTQLSGTRGKREIMYIRTAITIVLRDMYPEIDKYMFGLVFHRGHTYLNHCEKRHEEHMAYEDYKLIYDKVRKL